MKHAYQFGLELELFTLTKAGQMTNAGPSLLEVIKKKHPEVDAKKECGTNMIELITMPHEDVPNVIEQTIESLEKILFIAEKQDLIIYPYGTYPGSYSPTFNASASYDIKQKIFGKQPWNHAARCVGLHCHFSLPKEVFDSSARMIRKTIPQEHTQTLLDLYNFFIAADSALCTFAQSSPFYQGEHFAKDTRMVVYRGENAFKYSKGLYKTHAVMGELPKYHTSLHDLNDEIEQRYRYWMDRVVEQGGNQNPSTYGYASPLYTNWAPVKLNGHGTIEQRGMDINHPTIIVAIGIVIKYLAKMIVEGSYRIIISDEAIAQPFAVDRGKKTVTIPPYLHVAKKLQVKSAFFGMKDPQVYEYCKAFLLLAMSFTPKNRHELLQPLQYMVDTKSTTSDRIIEKAKLLGWKPDTALTDSTAAKLAVLLSKDLFKEILMTKHALRAVRTSWQS